MDCSMVWRCLSELPTGHQTSISPSKPLLRRFIRHDKLIRYLRFLGNDSKGVIDRVKIAGNGFIETVGYFMPHVWTHLRANIPSIAQRMGIQLTWERCWYIHILTASSVTPAAGGFSSCLLSNLEQASIYVIFESNLYTYLIQSLKIASFQLYPQTHSAISIYS